MAEDDRGPPPGQFPAPVLNWIVGGEDQPPPRPRRVTFPLFRISSDQFAAPETELRTFQVLGDEEAEPLPDISEERVVVPGAHTDQAEQELLAYDLPITRIIEENSIRDIQEIEDAEFMRHVEQVISTGLGVPREILGLRDPNMPFRVEVIGPDVLIEIGSDQDHLTLLKDIGAEHAEGED